MNYKTRNQGIAATLRYCFGPAAHLRTYTEAKGATFEFIENGEYHDIARSYHREDGGNGFSVQDAKSLVDEFIEVRKTLSAAIQNGGEWRNTECPQPE